MLRCLDACQAKGAATRAGYGLALAIAALVVAALVVVAGGLAPAALALPVHQPVPGGVAVVALPFEAEVSYRDRPVMVLQEGDTHYAVVGISLGAKPGVHKITAGDERIAFTVEAKHYEEQRLTIASKRQVNPYAEDMDRIIREKRQINAAYALFTPGAVETSFSLPVMGRTSSPFGLRRFLNGQRRSPHSGLDIAAPEGEVISAPASGTVAVTGDFFFTGYTVMVDHGQGLITLYSHLSKIEVAVGDELAAGDLIGLVGKTGRVTGAHLHWGVSLNNARVNPELFLVP